jgi:hypothetical protein
VNEKLFFFVSLHALDEGIYDRCTGTEGQLSTALEGTRRILAAGHPVTVNTVVTSENFGHLEEMVRRLPEVFSGERKPALHFSVLICPEWRPEAADYLVKYTELVPVLERAARTAEGLGIAVDSLLSSTHASMPPCVLPAEARGMGRHLPEIAEHETGYEDDGRPWVKAEQCRQCAETGRCLGVPRPYAAKFGLEELVPLTGGEGNRKKRDEGGA